MNKVYIVMSEYSSLDTVRDYDVEGVFLTLEGAKNFIKDFHDNIIADEWIKHVESSDEEMPTYLKFTDGKEFPETYLEIYIVEKVLG